MTNNHRAGRGGSTPLLRLLPIAALMLPLAACDLDDLLTVPDPEVASPGSLEGPEALPVLRAGAFTDFQVAFAGSGASEGQVNASAILGDEFIYASTFPTRVEVDQRQTQTVNATMEAIHRNLQRARASAERALAGYIEYEPNTVGHAEVLNLAGFSYILFAENYCSGVPFSRLTATGATEYGDPQTTAEMLQAAIAHFDAAIAAATAAGTGTAAVTQLNLARVGKGRALLNLGQFGNAAAAVAGVPTSFHYVIEHSTNSARQENGVHTYQWLGRRFSVADNEGGNGLPYRSANDPRVPWALGNGTTNVAFDNSPLYVASVFPSRSSPTVLATGVEARLIEAEAALQAGGAGWIDALNALRAAPPATSFPPASFPGIGTLAPLTDPGSTAARVDLHFQERAFWMFLSSHRLGDMRRLIRQYGRDQSTVFPVGQYGAWDPNKSGDYGTDVNLPVPFDEENNPLFEGCFDRNA